MFLFAINKQQRRGYLVTARRSVRFKLGNMEDVVDLLLRRQLKLVCELTNVFRDREQPIEFKVELFARTFGYDISHAQKHTLTNAEAHRLLIRVIILRILGCGFIKALNQLVPQHLKLLSSVRCIWNRGCDRLAFLINLESLPLNELYRRQTCRGMLAIVVCKFYD